MISALYASFECLLKRIFVGEFYFAAGRDAPAETGKLFRVSFEFVFDDHGIHIAVGCGVGGYDYFVGLAVELVLYDVF